MAGEQNTTQQNRTDSLEGKQRALLEQVDEFE
jgi:hypothetical protein